MTAKEGEYTPTPVISHAILTYNRKRTMGFSDGIVITPSHNPPESGGFKYNASDGGPANENITQWIQAQANEFLAANLIGVKRIPFEKALHATTTHYHDFLNSYVNDLGNVINMAAICDANIRIGVNPFGGAGVHYWPAIAHRYGLNLTVVNDIVDPTFSFMRLDLDGEIRMDPSSPYVMQNLIEIKDDFDIVCACDTDHDRHGIVTKNKGLLAPNHYLCAAIFYLFTHRPLWNKNIGVGKTVASSQMIDHVAEKLGHKLYEAPVGFKWFVEGLLESKLGFAGEESAGASFLRLNGDVWTTDKDGIVLALLAAEITAVMGRDPGEVYDELIEDLGESFYKRIDVSVTSIQKQKLQQLSPSQILTTELAGEKIKNILTKAPGNGALIGGIKIITQHGWLVIRLSGTEDIYKMYAESFLGEDHLYRMIEEGQSIVRDLLIQC